MLDLRGSQTRKKNTDSIMSAATMGEDSRVAHMKSKMVPPKNKSRGWFGQSSIVDSRSISVASEQKLGLGGPAIRESKTMQPDISAEVYSDTSVNDLESKSIKV